nr:hypothetical protein CFP56_60091 [Quercus suber]
MGQSARRTLLDENTLFSVCMFWAMSRVLDDPLIRNDHQGGAHRVVSRQNVVLGKVPDDCWVPDDSLIRDDRQGIMCHAVSGKVPDNCWVPDDPLVPDNTLIRDDC